MDGARFQSLVQNASYAESEIGVSVAMRKGYCVPV